MRKVPSKSRLFLDIYYYLYYSYYITHYANLKFAQNTRRTVVKISLIDLSLLQANSVQTQSQKIKIIILIIIIKILFLLDSTYINKKAMW